MTNPPSVPSRTRFICTKDDPYTSMKATSFGGRAAHPDAVESDTGSDDTVRYTCPHCGTTWKEELPE